MNNPEMVDQLSHKQLHLTSSPIQAEPEVLLCFSHLRWDFVFQRPQHLMTKAATNRRVFFMEEPVFTAATSAPHSEIKAVRENLWIIKPYLPDNFTDKKTTQALQEIVDQLLSEFKIHEYITWYYTPLALDFTYHLLPKAVVYDCMDELSAFKGASPALKDKENQLLSFADLVFTGGKSLYEAKRNRHPAVYAFPSSIDKHHFMQARQLLPDPVDQQEIPYPRLGFFGVVDERFDIELLSQLSARQPDWHFIIIGPIVKINEETLPKASNIHYLGMKSYEELPAYLSNWQVALLLFARNESTRFISPTKTPEYLAAFKPVVSTPIQDVIEPYSRLQLVRIGEDTSSFEEAIHDILLQPVQEKWKNEVESFLATNSWDITWQAMEKLVTSKVVH